MMKFVGWGHPELIFLTKWGPVNIFIDFVPSKLFLWIYPIDDPYDLVPYDEVISTDPIYFIAKYVCILWN